MYIKNFIDLIKKVIEKKELEEKEDNKKTKKILANFEPGDIIWAKRYDTEEEKKLIEEGHREGSFLVISFYKDGLICLNGTSTKPDKEKSSLYYEISNFINKNYESSKKIYYRLVNFKIIDDKSYIETMGSLKDEDLDRLLKEMKQVNKNMYNVNGEYKYFKIPIQDGDIIEYNKNYYAILDMDKEKFIAVLLDNYSNNLSIEDLKNIDYSKSLYLKTEGIYKIVNTLTNDLYMYLLKNQKNYLENFLNQKVPQRGSIILKNGRYYYIYGEEKQDWLVYEIKTNKVLNSQEININNTIFYTNFKSQKINKIETFDTIYFSTIEEIDDIKLKKEKYKEEQKKLEEYKKTENLRFNIGDIIEIENNKERFIIVGIYPNTYECLSISKIKRGIYDPVLIRKKFTKLSSNKSIEGIKWLEINPFIKLGEFGKKEILDKILYVQRMFNDKNNNLLSDDIKVGSIISYNSECYYVSSEEGNKWLCYKLNINFIPKQSKFKIRNKHFYTDYNVVEINKDDFLIHIYDCSFIQMEEIKENKRIYKIANKGVNEENIDIKDSIDAININDVILPNEFSDEEFIVVNIMGNTLCCVSYVDRNLKNPYIYYFNKDTVVKTESKRKIKK